VAAYSLAVWLENNKEVEGVLPNKWINYDRKIVRWPIVNSKRHLENLDEPTKGWLSFDLVKVKIYDGKLLSAQKL